VVAHALTRDQVPGMFYRDTDTTEGDIATNARRSLLSLLEDTMLGQNPSTSTVSGESIPACGQGRARLDDSQVEFDANAAGAFRADGCDPPA